MVDPLFYETPSFAVLEKVWDKLFSGKGRAEMG